MITAIAICILLFLGENAWAAYGDTVISYNFENGQMPNNFLPNAVAPQILTEPSGNHFLRMTASSSDCGPSFATTCPTVRAELFVVSTDWTASDANIVTYKFRVRSPSSNTIQGSVLGQIYFGPGSAGTPDTWATAWYQGPTEPGFRVTVIRDNNGYISMAPDNTYDVWDSYAVEVHFAVSGGSAVVYKNNVKVGNLVGRTVLGSDSPHAAQFYLNVYGGTGAIDYDDIQVIKGPYQAGPASPTATVTSISPSATVTSISPSAINLASPPATVTVTGTGLGDQGFGCPYVNFYTVPGDVRLLDAAAISCTSTTLVQTFNPALFTTPGTYRTKVWLRPSSSTWTLAGFVDFTVSGSVPPPVATITWVNDRGGSGTATGTTNWSISNIPLQPGVNNITVTATDAQGLSSTDNIAVTY